MNTATASSDPQPQPESESPRKKERKLSDFWRSMRSVLPYRRIVGISALCALFVGLATSASITTIMPIMRVLLNGQTIEDWGNGQTVEKRLGVRLADDNDAVRLIEAKGHLASSAGLKAGDQLRVSSAPESVAGASLTLRQLADPSRSSLRITVDGVRDVSLSLRTVPDHLKALMWLTSRVSRHPVWAVAEAFGALAFISILANILKFFQEYLSDKAATLAVNDIRRRLYDHVLHVPLNYFGTRGTTDLTSRLVQDCTALEAGYKTVLGQSIQQPITAGLMFLVALWTSWKLTLIIVVFGPLMGAMIQKFGKKMRRASRSALQKSVVMLGQIEGTLTGIRVVKAASAERFERRRYRGIMNNLVAEQLRMSRIDAFSSPTLETLMLLMIGCIILISTYMVTISHTIELAQFVVVMACLATIADSMRRLNKVNNVLQKSNAAAARIFETMDLPEERTRRVAKDPRARRSDTSQVAAANRKRIKLPALQREVRFENVTFSYPGTSAPALVDVDLTVPRSHSIAIVGRNGSGKTTLLALLPRFYDTDSGRVTIDGIDVRDATLRSLRDQISIVTQDSIIFPGTITENIAYGQPRATEASIIAAAKRAFAHDFIVEKPLGYATMLAGLGSQLSGGQKQRICIARAILRNAPILILDEATSQVDAESEHLIQQAIDGLMQRGTAGESTGPTTFVIAHRFSTILSADSIVVLDRGRIVGLGRHDELLVSCPTYQQLYERQLFAMPAA